MTAKNNNLSTLSDVLYDQLHRLNKDELLGDALTDEISRSTSIIGVSKEVVSAARLSLDAASLRAEYQGLHTADIAVLEKLS